MDIEEDTNELELNQFRDLDSYIRSFSLEWNDKFPCKQCVKMECVGFWLSTFCNHILKYIQQFKRTRFKSEVTEAICVVSVLAIYLLKVVQIIHKNHDKTTNVLDTFIAYLDHTIASTKQERFKYRVCDELATIKEKDGFYIRSMFRKYPIKKVLQERYQKDAEPLLKSQVHAV